MLVNVLLLLVFLGHCCPYGLHPALYSLVPGSSLASLASSSALEPQKINIPCEIVRRSKPIVKHRNSHDLRRQPGRVRHLPSRIVRRQQPFSGRRRPTPAMFGQIVDLIARKKRFVAKPMCRVFPEKLPSYFNKHTIDQMLEKSFFETAAYMGSSDICVGIMVDLDMCLTHLQTRQLHHSRRANRQKRKALKRMTKRWPNGIIPFEIIDGAFGQKDILVINEAMLEWEHHTCLKFRRSTENDRDRLVIQTGAGCFSNVGRIGGPQPLVLGTGICRTKKVVIHEMAHAIGMIHEHQRPDRDNFIRVHLQNVKSRFVNQFDTFPSRAIDNYGVEYDYLSIMHYGKTFFAEDGMSTTIETLDYAYQDMIGRTEELSFSDIKLVNAMYKCAEGCPNLRTQTCAEGGYLDKHCQCVCPDGGTSCALEVSASSYGVAHTVGAHTEGAQNANMFNALEPTNPGSGGLNRNSLESNLSPQTNRNVGTGAATSTNADDWRNILFGRNKVAPESEEPYFFSGPQITPFASRGLKRVTARRGQPLVQRRMFRGQNLNSPNVRFASRRRILG